MGVRAGREEGAGGHEGKVNSQRVEKTMANRSSGAKTTRQLVDNENNAAEEGGGWCWWWWTV